MADLIPPAPIGSPFGSSNWDQWYFQVRTAINNAQAVQWTSITGLPTTTVGYGIIDALWSNTQIKIQTAVANGVGGNIGTLTNSPVAGNPTKWLSVDDNGTTRYIPAW